MQAAQQNLSIPTPQIAPQPESEQSKPKRGGKRPGAGRKPNLAKRLLKGVTRDTLVRAVEEMDVGEIVVGLLRSNRELTRPETL